MSQFINLIPNHHTKITRLNTHHWFGVNCVIGQNRIWKRRPPPYHVRMVEGLNDSLPSLKSLYVPPYWLNGWRTPGGVALGCCLLKAVEGKATQYTTCMATDHHQEAYMSVMGILWRVAVVPTPVFGPPLVETGIHIGTWMQKANSRPDTNIKKYVGG